MENNKEMLELIKNNDIRGYELLKKVKLFCPIRFVDKIVKDKFGNVSTSKDNKVIFGMINDGDKSYYLAYSDQEKAKGIPHELLVMYMHDYYKLFCQDDCKASGIILNLNSDNIIIDRHMVAQIGYKAPDDKINMTNLNIYPADTIDLIKEFAKKNRDLKECYLLNYAKDDNLYFRFIIAGIKPNKLSRQLKTLLGDKIKNIPYDILIKDEENSTYCKQNILVDKK